MPEENEPSEEDIARVEAYLKSQEVDPATAAFVTTVPTDNVQNATDPIITVGKKVN